MVTIGVTGAAGLVGRQLVPTLADAPDVERVVGLDVREPIRRIPGVEFHLADVLHRELKPLLEGVDVLVHLASVVDPIPDERLMARVNVEGTRRVLDAASAVGVRKVVRVSSTAVYGAWPDNPVPITEDATLRPNPRFSPAVQAAEVERLLAEWRDDHPGTTVTILRTAPVLGPGAERLPSRLLLGRPRLRVRGATPAVQATHVDDLASAIALVTLGDHPGTFNVASDGWIDHEDVEQMLRPSSVPPLPAELLERFLERTWATGIGEIPPGVVPYLVHPWVVDNAALRAKGWRPTHSNLEAIRDGLAALPRRETRTRALAFGAGVVLGAAVTYALVRRRRSRLHRRRTR
ncbi:MAG: NAD-dependent epimerase/dehydratase family protein [Actinobacteria bacterium]|nr:NAD-dependent epimerase/dehydratase family protein [Actinomycetota bacterium]